MGKTAHKKRMVDVVIFCGLSLLASGIGMLSVPWALIVIGTLCIIAGVAGALR